MPDPNTINPFDKTTKSKSVLNTFQTGLENTFGKPKKTIAKQKTVAAPVKAEERTTDEDVLNILDKSIASRPASVNKKLYPKTKGEYVDDWGNKPDPVLTNLENKYIAHTSLNDTELLDRKTKVLNKFSGAGVLNSIGNAVGGAYNTVVEGVSNILTEGNLQPTDSILFEEFKKPFVKQANQEYAKNVQQWKTDSVKDPSLKRPEYSAEAINNRAIDLAVDKEVGSLKQSKINSFMSSLPESEKQYLLVGKEKQSFTENVAKNSEIRKLNSLTDTANSLKLLQINSVKTVNQLLEEGKKLKETGQLDESFVAKYSGALKSASQYSQSLYDTQVKANSVQKKLYSTVEKIKQIDTDINVFKKDYNYWHNLAWNVEKICASFTSGLIGGASFSSKFLPTNNIEESLAKVAKSINTQVTVRDEMYITKPENLESLEDVGRFATNELLNFGKMMIDFANPEMIALTSFVAMGAKNNEINAELEKNPNKYNDFQKIMIPLTAGALNQVVGTAFKGKFNASTALYSSLDKEGIKVVTDGTFSHLTNNTLEVALGKTGKSLAHGAAIMEGMVFANNLNDIVIGQNKEKNVMDGMKEVIPSILFFTAIGQTAPLIQSKVAYAISGERKIADLSKKIIDYHTRLDSPTTTEADITQLTLLKADAYKELAALTKKTFKDTKSLSDKQFQVLQNLNKKAQRLVLEANSIKADENLSKDLKLESLKRLEAEHLQTLLEKSELQKNAWQSTYFNELNETQRATYALNAKEALIKENDPEGIKAYEPSTEEIGKRAVADFNQVNFDIKQTRALVKQLQLKNTQVVASDNYQFIDQLVKDNKISEETAANIKETNGAFVKHEGDEGSTLFINKKVLEKSGFYTTGQHELIHVILHEAIKGNPELEKYLGKELLGYIGELNNNGVKLENTELAARINQDFRAVEDGSMKASDAYGEIMPYLSEAISRKDLNYSEKTKPIWEKIKNVFKKATDESNLPIKFDTGEDIFNFIKDYNKAFKEGELPANIKGLSKGEYKAIEGKEFVKTQPTSEESIKMSKPVEDRMNDLEDQYNEGAIDDATYERKMKALEIEEANGPVKEEAKPAEIKKQKTLSSSETNISEEDVLKNVIRDNKASVASDKVQSLYKAKGVDAAADIIKVFKPITAKIVDKRRDAPGFDKELLTDEIETGAGGLLDLIRSYNPDSGVPLAAYINKYLPVRAIKASQRVLDSQFSKDIEDQVSLKSNESADQGFKAEVPEANKYKTFTESKAFSPEVFTEIKADVAKIARTLKSKINEKVTLNKTVTPYVQELKDETGKTVDIIIKTALGGKKDKILPNNLIRLKRVILENMTTNWLAGKDVKGKVDGGVPQAIQKQVDGKWLNYPDWAGKKIDREAVTSFNAGRTSGNELTRRIPNAFAKISDIDFLRQFLEPSDNPIRGRKESLSKAMAEEISFEVYTDMLKNDPDFLAIIEKQQGNVGGVIEENIVQNIEKQFERGSIKFSKQLEELGLSKIDIDNFRAGLSDLKAELFASKSKIVDLPAIINKIYSTTLNDKTKIVVDFLKSEMDSYVAFNTKRSAETKTAVKQIIGDIIKNNFSVKGLKESSGFDINNKEQYDKGATEINSMLINEYSNKIKSAKGNEAIVIKDLINSWLRTLAHGNKSPYKSYKEFYDKLVEPLTKEFNIDGFSLKEYTIDGKSKSNILYNGSVARDLIMLQSSRMLTNEQYDAIFNGNINNESFYNTKKLHDENSTANKEILLGKIEFLKNGLVDGSLTKDGVGLYLFMEGDDMQTALRMSSKLGDIVFKEGEVFDYTKLKYEHEVPAKELMVAISDYFFGSGSKSKIIELLDKSRVNIIPKELDDAITKYGLKETSTKSGESRLDLALRLNPEFKKVPLQEARLKFSKPLSDEFNKIIERKTGIEDYKVYSDITARRRGASKGKYRFFIPPSAEDFMGLMYNFAGKGEQGDADLELFHKALVEPYTAGVDAITASKQAVKKDYQALIKNHPEVAKKLGKLIPNGKFTYDQAIRVTMWDINGFDIPGLTERDKNEMIKLVTEDQELADFTTSLNVVGNRKQGWIEPDNYWDVDTIVSELNNMTEGKGRKEYLEEFINNSNEMFSTENLNKIEAAYGNDFRDSLEDSLYRMTNGVNRSAGSDKITNQWMNWINNSNGTIMFFNTRSAILQTLGSFSYMNTSDNNPIMAAKAFANQPQFWKDFSKIFNSDKVKDRREGLKEDVSAAEIANAAAGAKNKPKAAVSWLLKKGYYPTQIADSFAIAAGGATLYRNRTNAYVKQGMSIADAETKAFADTMKVTRETQADGDAMMVSQQQTTPIGRLVLAFGNVSMQYNRIVKKAVLDLANRRGKPLNNIAKIVYYVGIQNVIFSSLQSGIFALAFGDDDEDKKKEAVKGKKTPEQIKQEKIIDTANGMIDTMLRGSGITGAVAATLKNTIMEYQKQEEKGFSGDQIKTLLQALNLSPAIGSKSRKVYNAYTTSIYEKDVIAKRGFSVTQNDRLDLSPMYSIGGNLTSAATNIPLERLVSKINNVSAVMDSRNKTWQRVAIAAGWQPFSVGVKNEDNEKIKEEAKAIRKEEGIVKRIIQAKATKDSIRNLPMEERYKLKLEKIEKKKASVDRKRRMMGY